MAKNPVKVTLAKGDPDPSVSWLSRIEAAAEKFGLRSFDNYAQIRSVAEKLRDRLCAHLDPSSDCTFLVPPQGEFGPHNYGSAAFSVSGKGFLPLEPISFGMAVRISRENDFMRLVTTARKEGDKMHLRIEDSLALTFDLPVNDHDLNHGCEQIARYVLGWFEARIDRYDHGVYGGTDIGFDIQRSSGK